MMKLVAACATDIHGKTYIDRHFGNAETYAIYQISQERFEYITSLPNTSEEERVHADPKKAGSISKILKEAHVQILIAKKFGPNIVRVKKHFIPIIVNVAPIEEGLQKVMENFDMILNELHKGEKRKHLVLK